MTRFKRLAIFGGALFSLVSLGVLIFGKEKISEFEIVLFNHAFRGTSGVLAFCLSLPFLVAFVAAFIASATWAEDKFRQLVSRSNEKE